MRIIDICGNVIVNTLLGEYKERFICKYNDQWMRDSEDVVYVDNRRNIMEITIEGKDCVAPALIGNYIGQEFILESDQRLCEKYNPNNKFKYKIQDDSLMIHPNKQKPKFATLEELKDGDIVSYKPTLELILKEFYITKEVDLSSSWKIIFEEK